MCYLKNYPSIHMVLDHPQITVIKSSKEKNIKILFGKEKKKKKNVFLFTKGKNMLTFCVFTLKYIYMTQQHFMSMLFMFPLFW